MNKRRLSLALFACWAAGAGLGQAEAPLPDDRVVIYDMKDDPTLGTFIGDPSKAKGFYVLEIDEARGTAGILFRAGETLYRADADLKVKGSQLTLKNAKHKKILIREKISTASGATQEAVYPIECPPDKGGWRRGPSFGRHIVRRDDDTGKSLIAGEAKLQFESMMERCGDPLSDCGKAGCEELEPKTDGKPIGLAAGLNLPPLPTPSPTPAKVPLAQAVRETKLSEGQMISMYKDDIDVVLPAQLTNLTATATWYRTTNVPYAGVADPSYEQRSLKIGVIGKRYAPLTAGESFTVEIEPLLDEFQAPSANKCGSFASGANRTPFDVRGRPAMYVQNTADQSQPGTSDLFVCGQTVSILVESRSARSQNDLMSVLDSLPFDDIERIVGGRK